MKIQQVENWEHLHTFGQDQKRSGETRTIIVIVITSAMMVIELITGVLFGSIALLADGLHMASHAAALTINLIAYIYARRHASDRSYSFGTGKVNALGGFIGAVLLAIFTLMMVWESIDRLLNPVEIFFNQAILVAILGLVVNGVSVFILRDDHDHHGHDHDHDSDHEHHDHNLRSAYLHVLADALTSFTAIFALLAGKYFGWNWMDPVMGFVGAFWVMRWSVGLLRSSSAVLLDRQGPETIEKSIRTALENNKDTRVTDLHLWLIGQKIYSLIVSLVSKEPQEPDYYKGQLPDELGLAHVSIEVNPESRLL